MEDRQLRSILESLLLVSTEPVTVDQLGHALALPIPEAGPVDKRQIISVLQNLKEEYLMMERGTLLVEVAGGYQLMTRPENAPWIKQLQTVKLATRLSRPALETLAIVAYRQPVSTPEIEMVRGVDCSGVLKTLLERRLVKIVGRKDVAGKPVLYGTTQEFLQHFGLRNISELPPLKEVQEVSREVPEMASVGQAPNGQ